MSQQMTAMSADIQALQTSVVEAGSSTFTRWGHSQCPSNTDLVYSGVVGGKHYSQSGGGSDYLCLTMSPVFSGHTAGSDHGYLYGAEYETFDAHMESDAVCAVCRSRHPTTIMIPGTNVCTTGWTKQYDGYLVGERDVHQRSPNFICVDTAMEERPGTAENRDGALLYLTVTQCGSLPCGPYENNRVVTCVVCSR
jgi:hypothetical protein